MTESMILNVSYKVFIFNPLVFSSCTVTIIAMISSPGEMMIFLINVAYKDTLTWIKKHVILRCTNNIDLSSTP